MSHTVEVNTPLEAVLVEQALLMAREAIELHLEGLIDDGQMIPEPRPVDEHQRKAEYRGGVCGFRRNCWRPRVRVALGRRVRVGFG